MQKAQNQQEISSYAFFYRLLKIWQKETLELLLPESELGGSGFFFKKGVHH